MSSSPSSLQRINIIIIIIISVLLCFFAVNKNNEFRVEGTLTSTMAKNARRSQSMRLLTTTTQSRKTGNMIETKDTHTQSGSPSSSSSSSTTSLTELQATDSQPIRIDSGTSFKDVDLKPSSSIADRTRHTSLLHSVDLHEASMPTQSIDGRVNPARDGVFARVRNAILRYGTAAAIGSAIGVTVVSGAELKKQLFPDSNNNKNDNITENSINTTTTTTIDSKEINNPM